MAWNHGENIGDQLVGALARDGGGDREWSRTLEKIGRWIEPLKWVECAQNGGHKPLCNINCLAIYVWTTVGINCTEWKWLDSGYGTECVPQIQTWSALIHLIASEWMTRSRSIAMWRTARRSFFELGLLSLDEHRFLIVRSLDLSLSRMPVDGL